MNREIKFRLRKDGQIVGYEMWFGGDGLVKPRWIYAYPDGYLNLYIEHDSKDQYTGLKDKNGIEIYEGDIVNWDGYSFEIRFWHGKWMLLNHKWRDDSHYPSLYTRNLVDSEETVSILAVIGNIYETPELLRKAA